MESDSSDVVIAKQLLDHAKLQSFTFQRSATGQDAPLIGKRVGSNRVDLIRLAGFSCDCLATRRCTSSLILVGNTLMQRWLEGSELHVLNEVLPENPGANRPDRTMWPRPHSRAV